MQSFWIYPSCSIYRTRIWAENQVSSKNCKSQNLAKAHFLKKLLFSTLKIMLGDVKVVWLNIRDIHSLLFQILHFVFLLDYIYFKWVHFLLIRLRNINPEHKCNSNQIFCICFWNLNSINAHNYLKQLFFRSKLPSKSLTFCVYQTLILSFDNWNLE